ncbi:hypothetical protein HDV01_001069 [Terramyces sp. JEL0728]|nr:hypothetical protein HDV01_001069 [Terramyces sp. JEL0728]
MRASIRSKTLKPFNSGDIKVLLLEGLNETGQNILRNAGYQVESHPKALDIETLKEKIKDVHAIGIRSKTQLTKEILQHAEKLRVIGCFCIGTNQVDLQFAASRGISVFNSPFSNSRSVAEMVIAQIIALSRQMGDRNTELHNGVWNKVSSNCHEIRGKSLGIIGYGHIGSQLSVLADSFGMKIYFFDILQTMPLGSAVPLPSLEELLSKCDFISLHVPETPETKNMVGKREFGLMKKGAIFINASRGTVVDIPSLKEALVSGHLAGAAVDVFPVEPFKNGPGFESDLIGCPNTILTPHIGGSTEEAQSSIGIEVGSALVKYINTGSTLGSVNFPEVDIRSPSADSLTIRVINIHQNVPGVLKQINKVLSDYNIEKQICDSKDAVAYFMADVTVEKEEDFVSIHNALNAMPVSLTFLFIHVKFQNVKKERSSAAEIHSNAIKMASENPLITLRIQQLGFPQHDFILTLSKTAKILHLQNEIARIQHDNAVVPSDILIFKYHVQTPSENRKALVQDDYSIGIPKESVCADPTQSILHYFPQIQKLKHGCQPTQFLHSQYKSAIPAFSRKYEFDLKLPKIKVTKQQDYSCPYFLIHYDVYTFIKLDMFTFRIEGDVLDKIFLKNTLQKKSKVKDKFDIRLSQSKDERDIHMQNLTHKYQEEVNGHDETNVHWDNKICARYHLDLGRCLPGHFAIDWHSVGKG